VRCDLIVDMASNHLVVALRRAHTREGTLEIVRGERGERFVGGVGAMMELLRVISSKQMLRGLVSATSADGLAMLAELVEAGTLTVMVEASHPLSNTSEAMERLQSSRATGKPVLTVAG
jgi:D-arabinose 1-dehydrogenase-like Zn-dependent alcohol dehydrogenase